jgi:hypothetical protein
MKRRRVESCALKNHYNGSCVFLSGTFQTRRPQCLEPFHSESSGDHSFRQQQEHISRHDMERHSVSNSSEVETVFISKAAASRGQRHLGLKRRMTSATIAALAICSISGTGATSVLPTTAALSYTEEKDLSIARSRDLRNLQGNTQKCKIALAVGDMNRNDLLDQSEYLRFVNQLGSKIWEDQNNDYVVLSSFDELPQSLKEDYDYFSNPELGQINISGSKPGQVPTPVQDVQINELCDLTSSKILDPMTPADPDPTDDGNPSTEKDCSGTVGTGKCNVDLSISDSNQNDFLDESDYVKFVNRLSSNKFANTQFGQLPLNIKENYYRFATKDGQVDVSGSKPGQRVSVEQDRFLSAFCCETDLAVQNPGSSVEPESNDPATPAPTFDLFFCQRSMASSDLDRDDGLNEEEYVIFLNRLTSNQFVGQTFDTLDADLQANFVNLVGGDGKIDIYGSKPGQASNFEEDNALVSVCVETGNALSGDTPPTEPTTPSPVETPTAKPSMNPPSSPVSTPSQAGSPTFAPGRSEAYNSFIISNKGGLKAANLTVGTLSRDGLDEAYGIFVQKAVENFSAENEIVQVRSLRHRKLAVDFLPESDHIYRIVDSSCPDGLAAIETCQTAFAKFQLTLDGEDAQDAGDSYTDYTQDGISKGELQVILKEVDERTILKIVDASYPVTPQAEEFTKAPTNAPTEDKGKERNNPAGPIVGGLFCVILLIAIIAYVYFKGLPFELPFELPSFPTRGGARVGNKPDDDDDDEAGLGLGSGQEEDDASVGEKDTFGKDFEIDNRNGSGDGDEDDGEQKDKNRFGFTNKHKRNDDEEEHIDFGLESKRDLNAIAADASDDIYAFEEPSEIDSETENQDDQKSADGNEGNAFEGKSESSNWGANNVFDPGSSNQEWGANGGEENFFGTSAFEEGKEEKELSQSGSEESESYTSEDETYESGEMDEREERSEQDSAVDDVEEIEQQESYTVSSADDSSNSESLPSEKLPSELRMKNDDMNAAIDNGDWDAVVEAAEAFDKSDQESSMGESLKKIELDDINDEDIEDDEDDSYSGSYSGSDDGSATTKTTLSGDLRKRSEYRAQVEELVQIVLPDETEKVDAMMDQFKGREAELVSTLQTMEERSSNQRARAAIHKSKPRSQQQNSAYSNGGTNGGGIQGGEGSTAGTAAIAAASLPIPAEGVFGDKDQEDGFDGDFGRENAFGDEGGDQVEETEYSNNYDDQSYYSGEDSQGSGSFYSEEEDSASGSSYSEEGSQAKSFFSHEEGSQKEEGSFYSQEEGSQQREEGSQGGSFYSQEEGSPQQKSLYSQEGESNAESYYSEEGSQSYYSETSVSGEDGSFYSEEESAKENGTEQSR